MLFVDNCPAHPSVTMKGLRAVAVALLTPNTTIKLQPLDQGVIKNLKHHYRKRTIRKVLELTMKKYSTLHFWVVL
jgi:hypothetical protein